MQTTFGHRGRLVSCVLLQGVLSQHAHDERALLQTLARHFSLNTKGITVGP